MSRINVKGVIVSSTWDQYWTQEYIEKGIITPESSFLRNLSNAKKDEDLELYINSRGGSVIAGNSMINELNMWKKETGKNVNVIAGAMVASQASVMLVDVADKVTAFNNTKIMFHGVQTEVAGGSGALQDNKDLVDKMNSEIKMKLVNKYNISPDKVDLWLSEGRQGWLNAKEGKEVGMIDEIINEQDIEIKPSGNEQNMLKEYGQKMAACELNITQFFNNKKEKEMNLIESIKNKMKSFGLQETTSDEDLLNNFDKLSEKVTNLEAEKVAMKEGFDKEKNELTEKLTNLEAEKVAMTSAFEKEKNELTEKLTNLESEKASLQNKMAKMTGGLKPAGDDKEYDSAKEQFSAKVREVQKEQNLSFEQATLKVKNTHKELYNNMLKEANPKQEN